MEPFFLQHIFFEFSPGAQLMGPPQSIQDRAGLSMGLEDLCPIAGRDSQLCQKGKEQNRIIFKGTSQNQAWAP